MKPRQSRKCVRRAKLSAFAVVNYLLPNLVEKSTGFSQGTECLCRLAKLCEIRMEVLSGLANTTYIGHDSYDFSQAEEVSFPDIDGDGGSSFSTRQIASKEPMKGECRLRGSMMQVAVAGRLRINSRTIGN